MLDVPLHENRRNIPHEVDAARASIGVVALASDQTLEGEFRRLLDSPDVSFYVSRLRNENAITAQNLGDMEHRLTDAAALLLPDVELDVVAFGCTSGSIVIGEERVFERLGKAKPNARFTTPITAAGEALRAFGAESIALLTPYRDDINHTIRDYLHDRGVAVPVMGSFNEEDDRRAARITVASIREAAVELGRSRHVDAVFVSCTNLRFAHVVAEVEAELGKPATSSNHALAWHCLRLAGVSRRAPELGRLFDA